MRRPFSAWHPNVFWRIRAWWRRSVSHFGGTYCQCGDAKPYGYYIPAGLPATTCRS
jgi:hypothetical protein